MALLTERLGLPLLATAQAQKEMTHNEALILLDGLVQPAVVSVAPVSVPGMPVAGQAWVVGPSATGDWTGHDGAIALYTAGGWRFVPPREGMAVWSIADGYAYRRIDSSWVGGVIKASALSIGGMQVVGSRGAAVVAPSGGAVIDVEARAALSAALERLRSHGLIAG